MSAFERITGVKPVFGGTHEGLGTHNALVALGDGAYLELLARDPSQDAETLPKGAWMGIDSLEGSEFKVLTWAVDRGGEINEAVARARSSGASYDPGEPETFTRGDLSWTLSYRHYSLESMGPGSGIVPFLIDWNGCKSPAASAPRGCELLELKAVSRNVEAVSQNLKAVGVDPSSLGLKGGGSTDSLVAVLQTPKGVVEF